MFTSALRLQTKPKLPMNYAIQGERPFCTPTVDRTLREYWGERSGNLFRLYIWPMVQSAVIIYKQFCVPRFEPLKTMCCSCRLLSLIIAGISWQRRRLGGGHELTTI